MSVENTQRIKALLTGGARQQSLLGGSGLTRPSNELLAAADGVENTAIPSFSQETRGCFQNANSNNRYGNKQSNLEDKAQEVSQLPPNIPDVPQFNKPSNPLLFTNYGIGLQRQWSQHMAKLVTYQRFHLQNLYGTLAANALINTAPNLDHPASVADKSTLPSTTNVGHTGPKTTKLQSGNSKESSKSVRDSNISSNAKTQASASSKIIDNKGDGSSIYKKDENKQKVVVSESLSSITGSKLSVLASSCTQATNTTSTLQTSTTANAIKEKTTVPSKRSLANSMLCHPKMRAKTRMVALTSTKRKESAVPVTNATLQQSEPPKPPTTIDFSKVTIPIGSLNDNSQLMMSQSSRPLMTTQSPQITMASHSTSTPLEMASPGSLNSPKVSSQLSKTTNNCQKHVKGQRLAQVIEKIGSTPKIPVFQNPSSPKKTRKMSKPLKKCQDTIEDAIDKTVAIAKALADCEITDATLPKRWSSTPHLADSFSGYDVIINPPRHKSMETYEKPFTTRSQRENKFYNPAAGHVDTEGGTLKSVERDQKVAVSGLTCKAASGTNTSISTGVVTSVIPTSFPAAENAGIVTKTQHTAVSTPQNTQTLPSPFLQSWFSSKQTESLEMQVVGNYPSSITISKKLKANEGSQKQKHTTMKHQSVIRHTSKGSTQEKHSNAKELELEIEHSKTSKMPLLSKSLASENPVLSDSALSQNSAQDMTLNSKRSRSSPDVVRNSRQGKCVSTHQQIGPKTTKQNWQPSSISIPSNLAPLQAPEWYQRKVITVTPGIAENSRVATKPHNATCASSTPNEPLDYSMGTLKKVEERQKQREDEQGYALDLSLPRRQHDRTVGGQLRNDTSPSVTIAASSTSEVSTMKVHSLLHPVPDMRKFDALCMAALSTLSDTTPNTKKKSKVQGKLGKKRPKRLKRNKMGDSKSVTSHEPKARDPKAGNTGMAVRSNDGIGKGEFEIGSYLEVTRKAMTEVENKQHGNEELTNTTGDENHLIQQQDSHGGSAATKSRNPEQIDNVAEKNQPPVQLSENKSQRQETEDVDPKSLAEYINREGNIKNIEKKSEDDIIVVAKDKEPIKSETDLVVMKVDPKRFRYGEGVFGDIEKPLQLVDKVDQANGGHVGTNSEPKSSAAMPGGNPKVQTNYEADVSTDSTKVSEVPRQQCPKKLSEDTVRDRNKVNQGIVPSVLRDLEPLRTQAMSSYTPPLTMIETAINSGSHKSAEVTEAPHHQCPKKLFEDTVTKQKKVDQGIQPYDFHHQQPSRTPPVTPIETAIEGGSYSSAQVTEVSHHQCRKKLLEDTVENQKKIDQEIQPFVLRDPEPWNTQTMCSAIPRETAIDSIDINRMKCLAALKSQNRSAKSRDSDKTSEEYISVKDTSSCSDDDKVDEGGKSTANTKPNQAFEEGLFSDASDPELFSDDLLFSGDEHERISLKSKKKIAIRRKINLGNNREGQAEDKCSGNPRTALVWKNIDSPKSLGEERRNSPIVPEFLQKFTTMTSSGRAQFLGHLVQHGDGAQLRTAEFQKPTEHYWHSAAVACHKIGEVNARSCELNSPPKIKDSILETATKSDRKVEINTKGINSADSEDVFSMISQYAESIPFYDIFQTPLKSSHKKLAQSDSNESRSSEHEIIVITPESLNSEKQSSSDINSDRKEDPVAENAPGDDEDVATCVSGVVRDLSESNAEHGAEGPYTAQNTRDETKLNEVSGCNPKVQAADDSDDDADVAVDNDDDDKVVFPSEQNPGVNLSKVADLPNSEAAVRDVVRVGKVNSVREAIPKEKRGDVLEKQQVDLKDEPIGNQKDTATENMPVKMTDSSYSVFKAEEKTENAEKSSRKTNKDSAQQHGVITTENMSMKVTTRQSPMTVNATDGHECDSRARKTFNPELKESTENLKVAEKSDIQSKKVSKPRSLGKKKKYKAPEKRKEKTPNKLSLTRIRTTPTKRPNVKSERSKLISPTNSGKRKTGYNIHADLKGCDIKIKRRKLVKKDTTSSLPKVFKTPPKRITSKHDPSSDSSDSSSDEAENFFKTEKIAKNITKFRSPPEVTPPPKVLQSSLEEITSVVPHDDVSSDSSDSSDEDEAFCRTDKMAKKFNAMVGSPSEVTHDSNHEKENTFKSMNMAFPSTKPTTPKTILGAKQNITSSPSTLVPNVSKSTESSSLYTNSPLIKRCSVRLDHSIQSPSDIFQSSAIKIQITSKDITSASPLKRKNISSDDAISAKSLKNSVSSDVELTTSSDSTEDEGPLHSSFSSTSGTSTGSTTSDTSTRTRPTINLKAFVREAYSSSKECIRGAIVASASGTGKIPKAPALNTKRKHGRWPFTAPFEARSQLVKPLASDTTPGLKKSASSPLKPRNETEGIKPHRPLKPKFQVQEHNISGPFETLHNVWRKSEIKTLATAQTTTLPYPRESQTTEDESLKNVVDDIIQMSPPKKLKKSIIKPTSSSSQEKKFTKLHRTLSHLPKKKKTSRMAKQPKSTIRTQKSSRSPPNKSTYIHRSTTSLTKKKKAFRMETDPKSLILTQKSLRSPGKKSTDTRRSKPSLPKKKKASKMEIDPVSSVTAPNSPRSPAKKSIYNNRSASSLPKNEQTPRTDIEPNSSIIIPISSGSQATKISITATNHFTTSLPKKSTPRTETEPKSSIITAPPKSSGIQARKSMSANRFPEKKQTARIKGNWTTETFPDIGKISNVALIHHQQSKGISKAERDENIYLTMQKLLNMGLIMDQMPRRGVPALEWGDPMEFANMNEESYELPEPPVSSEHIEEIPIHPNLKVEWYTSQQVQLKPCSVVLRRLEIQKSRVNLISF